MSELKKTLICAILIMSAFVGLAQGAFAQQTDETQSDDERFFNKSWEEITKEFIDGIGYGDDGVAIAYMNTVTGETHYYNPDLYMYAASVYKLPLNMYFGELISDGEMTMETRIGGVEYDYVQTLSLEYSSNPMSEMMTRCFGDYKNFRTEIMKYLGVTTEDVDDTFYTQNIFTVRQILNCLEILYNDPGRYPNVLEHMGKAQQDEYFAMFEERFKIAHKYGYYSFETYTEVNDCGIIYTDDPILLVMFTSTYYGNPPALGRYCELMCDYTQYKTQARLRQENAMEAARINAQELSEPDTMAEPSPSAAEPTPAVSETPESAGQTETEETVPPSLLWPAVGVLGVLLCAMSVILAIKNRQK